MHGRTIAGDPWPKGNLGVGGGEIGGHFRGEKGATNSVRKGTGSKLGTGMHGRKARPQGSLALGTSAAKVALFLTATDNLGHPHPRPIHVLHWHHPEAVWARAKDGSAKHPKVHDSSGLTPIPR